MGFVTLARPQLIEFNNNKLTEHNRQPMQIEVERIETKQRMANGNLRKYVVADKRSFTLTWNDVPHDDEFTVDGFWGAEDIIAFHTANAGSFDLKIVYDNDESETVSVMFSDLNHDLKRRGKYRFYDVTVGLEEV